MLSYTVNNSRGFNRPKSQIYTNNPIGFNFNKVFPDFSKRLADFKINNIEKVNNFISNDKFLLDALLRLVPLLRKYFDTEYLLDVDEEFLVVSIVTDSTDGYLIASNIDFLEEEFENRVNNTNITNKILLSVEFI